MTNFEDDKESYPTGWLHATLHLNPATGELHSDGNHDVRLWIEKRMKWPRGFLAPEIDRFIEEHPNAIFSFHAQTSGSSSMGFMNPVGADTVREWAEWMPVVSWGGRFASISEMWEDQKDFELWREWMQAGMPGFTHKGWTPPKKRKGRPKAVRKKRATLHRTKVP